MVPNVESAFITQAGSERRQTQRICPAEFVASRSFVMRGLGLVTDLRKRSKPFESREDTSM